MALARIDGFLLTAANDDNNNNNKKKTNMKLQHIMIEFDCWDWDTIGSDDHIGKHTERLEYGQDNIIEKWVTLYNNDNDDPQGKLLITVECENLWTE